MPQRWRRTWHDHRGDRLRLPPSTSPVWPSPCCSWRRRRRRHVAATWRSRGEDGNAPLRLGVRLGLHAGRVFVGPAGGGGRFAFAIIGDIANTASRIEALNKQLGTRLLASAEVVAGLDDLLVRPLGEFRLTGRQGVVSVVEIMGLTDGASMAQLSLCGRFPAAVQAVRKHRWAEAAACFEAILRDHPRDGPSRFYLDRCFREMQASEQ